MVANLKRHRFLGRPVKPLAIGIILALFLIASLIAKVTELQERVDALENP